ncbi:PTS lactose/cellobiose transporter subunit IIA [Maledivibacter halophilus]|uniref:PTS system, cellobiose-specific IIA component n=1 Tax=Maledivibacter halophilus TaxID=36842 RepID=A0A1T5KDJ5_9FIRM|nr:PTS lactose/cellobiose transporter subunit IIA [Maledivibacter halophilus]SKC61458.1 PTS system, cellobiose-specific IIA component [Maledivibacter halophilus]
MNEQAILNLISYSGSARSNAIEAMENAKKNDFDKAKKLLEESAKELHYAHESQTELIRENIKDPKSQITLLMVHAQDHMMTSQTLMDLAKEIIDLRYDLYEMKKK